MSVREAVRRLLDPVDGLRCVPRFMRRFLCQTLQDWEEQWLTRYVEERLGVLVRFIEPLAGAPVAGGHSTFAALCRDLAQAEAPTLVAERLGLRTPAPTQDQHASDPSAYHTMWLQWVGESADPAARLYCLANINTAPVLRGPDTADLEGGLFAQVAVAFHDLGHAERAVPLLEGWLGLQAGHYLDRSGLARVLPRSPLAHIHSPDTWAWVVGDLAYLLLFTESRGPEYTANFLEAVLGLTSDVWGEDRALERALARSPLARVADPARWGTVLGTLAKALKCLEGRAHHTVALLEGWLQLRERAYEGPEQMALALGTSPFYRIASPGLQAELLCELADALLHRTGDGPQRAATLLEGWLQIPPAAYESRISLRDALRTSRLAPVSRATTWTNFLRSLASALLHLNGRGPRHAGALLEVWLAIPVWAYEDPRSLAQALHRSPLAGVDEPVNQANFVFTLADVLRSTQGREGHAVALLEAWIGLGEEVYDDPEALSSALRVSKLSVINNVLAQANLVTSLSGALVSVGRETHAAALLESWLGIPVQEFATAPRLNGLPATTVLGVAQLWLRAAGPTHPQFLATCEATLRHICRVRDEVLYTTRQRQDFLQRVSHFHEIYRAATLLSADVARDAGRGNEADALELQVLAWAEEFENQELLERMRALPGGVAAGVDPPPGWVPGQWPLPENTNPPPSDHFYDGYLPPADPYSRPPALVGVLETRRAERVSGQTDSTQDREYPRDTSRWQRLSEELPSGGALTRFLPEGTVWIRMLFDMDDALRWWAVCGTAGGELELLARGRSQPRARQRLKAATLDYDLAVEAVWANYRSRDPFSELDQASRLLLASLPELVSDPTPPGGEDEPVDVFGTRLRAAKLASSPQTYHIAILPERSPQGDAANSPVGNTGETRYGERDRPSHAGGYARELFAGLWEAIRQLRERRGQPLLANLGFTLLTRVRWAASDPNHPVSPEGLERWRRAVQALSTPWQEAVGSAERDVRRRRELEEATGAFLRAVEREVCLEPLWAVSLGRVCWPTTDVVLQVQGPLWAAPLAWLNLGGRPLFRRAASTSAVVSLKLRQPSGERSNGDTGASPHLLSALWLEPEDWECMNGLAYLHAGLERVGRRHAWQVWGLGSNPEASVKHLQAALARRDHPFRVVVLGGHGAVSGIPGVVQTAWVALADGKWSGEGTELSGVDLLLLVSCAVGRLGQEGGRDVMGLYAELLTHGARCAVTARWPIPDTEAAVFATEVVHQYLTGLRSSGGRRTPFDGARALNRARQALLDHDDPAFRVSTHLAAAFDIFGIG